MKGRKYLYKGKIIIIIYIHILFRLDKIVFRAIEHLSSGSELTEKILNYLYKVSSMSNMSNKL
jgi:hypothetical protein